MKKNTIKALLLCALAGISAQASAHIGYGSDLSTLGATTTMTVTSNAGYIAGLQSYTGDTHNTRARWFRLTQTSLVNFTITGLANNPVSGNTNAYLNGLTASVLNPAFSLYREVNGANPFPSEHDGAGEAALDPTNIADATANGVNDTAYAALAPSLRTYLANETGYASWSPFAKVNPLIAYAKTQEAGIWPLQTNLNWGVFDGNGDFSAANDAGQVNFWDFLTTGTDPSATTVSFSGTLGPGIYSIFIGGDDPTDFSNLLSVAQGSNSGTAAGATVPDFLKGSGTATEQQLYAGLRLARSASITFTATPVPVPAAAWLLGSALLGMVGICRRRRS